MVKYFEQIVLWIIGENVFYLLFVGVQNKVAETRIAEIAMAVPNLFALLLSYSFTNGQVQENWAN